MRAIGMRSLLLCLLGLLLALASGAQAMGQATELHASVGHSFGMPEVSSGCDSLKTQSVQINK